MRRFYRFFLRAYPARFRDDYQDELVAFFEDQRHDPCYWGTFGPARL